MAGWPKLPMMDPNSEAEILPSPLTSNFLKTCSSSAIWIGVSSDPEFVFEFVVVVVVVVVVVDELRELLGESVFFLRWKRDLKPMISFSCFCSSCSE